MTTSHDANREHDNALEAFEYAWSQRPHFGATGVNLVFHNGKLDRIDLSRSESQKVVTK